MIKRVLLAVCTVGALFAPACSSEGSEPAAPSSKAPSNDQIASQIEAAYVPAKACWDSFRDASCPSVYATVEKLLADPFEELQKQGDRELSVRGIAAAEQKWDSWLSKCIDDYTAVRNASFCLESRPTSSDLDEVIALVRQGK